MTIELKMLALAVVLGLVQVILASHAASLERGYLWTAGARDEALPSLSGVAGRLQRALQNEVLQLTFELEKLFTSGSLH